jgi:hypothetical protein
MPPFIWLPACPRRFACGEAELSKEDRIKLALQRGRACFDHVYYKAAWPDLANYTMPRELWIHYVDHGQFEGREARCGAVGSRQEEGVAGGRAIGQPAGSRFASALAPLLVQLETVHQVGCS